MSINQLQVLSVILYFFAHHCIANEKTILTTRLPLMESTINVIGTFKKYFEKNITHINSAKLSFAHLSIFCEYRYEINRNILKFKLYFTRLLISESLNFSKGFFGLELKSYNIFICYKRYYQYNFVTCFLYITLLYIFFCMCSFIFSNKIRALCEQQLVFARKHARQKLWLGPANISLKQQSELYDVTEDRGLGIPLP